MPILSSRTSFCQVYMYIAACESASEHEDEIQTESKNRAVSDRFIEESRIETRYAYSDIGTSAVIPSKS